PNGRINLDQIEPYWNDILRLMVSIKLKETTASQIFRRLNSYSAGENPVYDALKEFGRIHKSIFILTYIDDPDYRDAITKQLNKGESGNKLARALAIGSPEFVQATKEEQEIAEACKRLLKNAIVCWNYMYLSQLLALEKDKAKKAQLVADIRKTSVA